MIKVHKNGTLKNMHFEIFDSGVYKDANIFYEKSFPHFCCKFCYSCGWSITIIFLCSYLISTKTHFLTIFEHFEKIFCNCSIFFSKFLFLKQLIAFFQKIVCLLCSWKILSQFMFYGTWTVYWYFIEPLTSLESVIHTLQKECPAKIEKSTGFRKIHILCLMCA